MIMLSLKEFIYKFRSLDPELQTQDSVGKQRICFVKYRSSIQANGLYVRPYQW